MPRRDRIARTRPPADQDRATALLAAPGRRMKSQSVVDTLGLKIVSGELESGALLPTEAELSLRMGLSRPSLREGLRALAQKGLVEARTRRGTKVHDKAHWNVLDADVLRWIAASPPDPAFFMDLLDARNIFEPAAARLAAARATPEQILAIEHAFREMAKSLPDDVDGCCRHDLAFHELIIAATGNRLLIGFAGAIRTALLAAFRLSGNARESYENSLSEHWAVAAAIRRRSPDEADQAMRILLAGTARDLSPAYASQRRGKSPRRSAAMARRRSSNRG
jgi:GntR family transcriptional regulator, galactonate operon transcriptional repressor